MKSIFKTKHGLHLGNLGLAAACWWLTVGSINAANTTFTAIGYAAGVPVYGARITNNAGQVSVRGNVHLTRMQSANPLMTGRMCAFMDEACNDDGSGQFTGNGYFEAGTWNLADTNNPLFTPNGAVAAMNFRGVFQPDFTTDMELTEHYISGPAEGTRIACSAHRGPGPLFDPAIPYTCSGTIIPPLNSTLTLLDDFNDGVLSNKWGSWCTGAVKLTESAGQLTVQGSWSTAPNQDIDVAMANWMENWKIEDGQTMEWRANINSLNPDAEGPWFVAGYSYQKFSVLMLTHNAIIISKWTATGGNRVILNDPVSIRQTNIILSMAITRQNNTGFITARVLDKDDPDTVLYSKMVLDPTPYFDGDFMGMLVQPKRGQQRAEVAEVTFDNYTRRLSTKPQMDIGKAVCITCAMPEKSQYSIEAAPTVDGPWLPYQPAATSGLFNISIPVTEGQQFFRLHE